MYRPMINKAIVNGKAIIPVDNEKTQAKAYYHLTNFRLKRGLVYTSSIYPTSRMIIRDNF